MVKKLKLQYFVHLMQRANSLEKTLMLGKIEKEKGATEDEMVGWHLRLDRHEFEQTGKPGVLQSMGVAKSWRLMTEWQHNRGEEHEC